SFVQATPSLQLVGQAPGPEAMPLSQASPASSTPSPQLAEQSSSLAVVQPSAQQPSPSAQAEIEVTSQVASQVAVEPTRTLGLHASVAVQLVGQLAPSQASPGSRTLLPQVAVQSSSFVASAPSGQQVS